MTINTNKETKPGFLKKPGFWLLLVGCWLLVVGWLLNKETGFLEETRFLEGKAIS